MIDPVSQGPEHQQLALGRQLIRLQQLLERLFRQRQKPRSVLREGQGERIQGCEQGAGAQAGQAAAVGQCEQLEAVGWAGCQLQQA